MTQKSVSIRANVSIRGVTIRAYALYIIIYYTGIMPHAPYALECRGII